MNSDSLDELFPRRTPAYILSFQFSSWYPAFSDVSIKSTIIRPLSDTFREYLESDSVFVPVGSEDVPAESTLSDDEGGDECEEGDEPKPSYTFPELDAKIRECITQYESVFPKLNFTSPRDASWILPASSPLKCTSPADVYMLLKSSDFISHDVDPENVFEGCEKQPGGWPEYPLELVLRKWYPINPSRELRCFVRDNKLIGISQRDTNYYAFLGEVSTQERIVSGVSKFWNEKIKSRMHQTDYIFDFLLTRDLTRGHIIDFNPYSPRTDSLLFSYEELAYLAATVPNDTDSHPEFRYIDTLSHPAAARNAPMHQQNMIPYDAVELSNAQHIDHFAQIWKNEIQQAS